MKNKCLLVSTLTHALLVVAVVIGSAFKSSQPKPHPDPFELTDLKLTDQDSGTQNQATEPARSASQSQYSVSPNTHRNPGTPNPQNEKVPKPSPEARIIPIDPGKIFKRRIPTKPVDPGLSKESVAENRKQLAQRGIDEVVGNLSLGLSGSTTIATPGVGKIGNANYAAYLKQIYEEIWIPPSAALGNEPSVEVEVTISKNGQVLSTRLIKKSGRSNLDNSVENALDRIKTVRPFPEGSTDEKRVFRINFNLTTKLGAG